MNTAAHSRCQTSGRRTLARRRGALLLCLVLGLGARAGWTVPPQPAAWQRELDALRLADATAALASGTNPAAADETNRRLGELYRLLAAKYPGSAAVQKAAGDHCWRAGEAASAIAAWQAAQNLDPTDAETASALGSAWLRDGRAAAARAEFQRAVEASPGVARYHSDLANVLFVFRHEFAGGPGQPAEAAVLRDALAHFRRASELAGENVEYARAYAETFYGVPDADWEEAFAAWERVRALSPAAPALAVAHLARISLRLGKPEQAEAYLDAIHDPAFAPVKTTLRRQAEEMKRRAATPQRNSVPSPSR